MHLNLDLLLGNRPIGDWLIYFANILLQVIKKSGKEAEQILTRLNDAIFPANFSIFHMLVFKKTIANYR